jgi:hypothetical protein
MLQHKDTVSSKVSPRLYTLAKDDYSFQVRQLQNRPLFIGVKKSALQPIATTLCIEQWIKQRSMPDNRTKGKGLQQPIRSLCRTLNASNILHTKTP